VRTKIWSAEIVVMCLAATLWCGRAASSPNVADADDKARNAQWREDHVVIAREKDGTVELIYEGDPLRGVFDARALGVRVASVRIDDQAPDRGAHELVARIVIDEVASEARVDDSVADAAVVAIFHRGVLLVHPESQALFFAAIGEQLPRFQVVWRSSFSFAPPPAPPTPSKVRPAKSAKSPRR
jgi:hypothetical protein